VSIVYVAVENLVVTTPRSRELLTFGFGLIHGLSFASALQDHGLGASPGLAMAGFNMGVEVGQACVVLALFPLVRIAQRRRRAFPWMLRLTSVAIACSGAYWMVQRAIA
jgi:hypothetical protein